MCISTNCTFIYSNVQNRKRKISMSAKQNEFTMLSLGFILTNREFLPATVALVLPTGNVCIVQNEL